MVNILFINFGWAKNNILIIDFKMDTTILKSALICFSNTEEVQVNIFCTFYSYAWTFECIVFNQSNICNNNNSWIRDEPEISFPYVRARRNRCSQRLLSATCTRKHLCPHTKYGYSFKISVLNWIDINRVSFLRVIPGVDYGLIIGCFQLKFIFKCANIFVSR